MARKLAVANVVQVPVTLTLSDDSGKNLTYSFTLTCERITQAELRAAATAGADADVKLMTRVTKGWKDQRLVLEEDGTTPSPFSDGALEDMLSIAGVAGIFVDRYAREVQAKAKN